MKSSIVLFAVLILVNIANSQDEPKLNLKFSGTVQPMVSYSQTNKDTAQIGFGLHRVRARMIGEYSDFIKCFVQFELTSPRLVDARLDYIASKAFMVRVGRFPGAGVRAGGLTPHTDIDIIERAASAIYWGKATVGADFRDYGIAFLGDVNGFNYNLTIHNGNGTANIQASHVSLSSMPDEGIAISGMVFYKPLQLKGFEAGGYYGNGNKYINYYTSYNAYIYYEPLPYRLKAEVISFTDKNGGTDSTSLGYYVFGALRFAQNFEGLARFEVFDPNTNLKNDKQTDITIGLAYSFFPVSWQNVKITGAYVIRREEGTVIKNNILYLMIQTIL
jgi:hypothetical protein